MMLTMKVIIFEILEHFLMAVGEVPKFVLVTTNVQQGFFEIDG